jgi:hypothetical protein
MTPIGSAVISAGLRRLVAAALFMAAALGVFGHPAIARADWDIGEYDQCMATPSNTWHRALRLLRHKRRSLEFCRELRGARRAARLGGRDDANNPAPGDDARDAGAASGFALNNSRPATQAG